MKPAGSIASLAQPRGLAFITTHFDFHTTVCARRNWRIIS
jgi:hypothetical protein